MNSLDNRFVYYYCFNDSRAMGARRGSFTMASGLLCIIDDGANFIYTLSKVIGEFGYVQAC